MENERKRIFQRWMWIFPIVINYNGVATFLCMRGANLEELNVLNLKIHPSIIITMNNKEDFKVLWLFRSNGKPRNASSIMDVLWQPPLPGCVKANTDGSALESPTAAAKGILFRDHHANYLRGSSQNIGYQSFSFAEFQAVLKALEIAKHKNWKHLWIESDSMNVVLAYKNTASEFLGD
jgi:hypothetical protein